MWENIVLGFSFVFQPINLFICLLGLFMGTIFGALPGFSATMAVALMVPFSYVLDPATALLLLSAVYCGGVYGGSISAVLLGIPGTPASAPTAFEGKAFTKQGKSGYALTMCTVSSSIGGFLSSVALLVCAPFLAKIAVKFSAPEQMLLAVFGISVVCLLSKGNAIKGVIVALLALLIGTMGQDPITGYPRFTFGNHNLLGGVSVVPVLIGIFSLPEVFLMLEDLVGEKAKMIVYKLSKFEFRKEDLSLKNFINLMRSAIIGIVIGIIPAAGPDVASFLSYNEAKKASKEPELFGNGSTEGIIASETANNAVTGGSLIPLLTLSIPGSAPAALFLGAMIIHGLRPGPMLFVQNASEVYTLISGFALINILMIGVGLICCKGFSMMLKVPKPVLMTVIVVLSTIGAFAINKNMLDIYVMFISGVIGYIMVKFDYPMSPIALALLLGPTFEKNFQLSTRMFNGDWSKLFQRPMSLVLLAIIFISIGLPYIKDGVDKMKASRAARKEN